MKNKGEQPKLQPGQTYLFRIKSDVNSLQQSRLELLQTCEGQLYGLLDGELEHIFAYAEKQDAYNKDLLECIGVGEFVGIEFTNGQLSVGLQSFLKKPENQKYAKQFFPRRKK